MSKPEPRITVRDSIRQAIVTRFAGPTESRGSRIIASAGAGTVVTPYDHALNRDDMHAKAAMAVCAKYGWEGELVMGGMPDGFSRVFVFTETPRETEARLHRETGKEGA